MQTASHGFSRAIRPKRLARGTGRGAVRVARLSAVSGLSERGEAATTRVRGAETTKTRGGRAERNEDEETGEPGASGTRRKRKGARPSEKRASIFAGLDAATEGDAPLLANTLRNRERTHTRVPLLSHGRHADVRLSLSLSLSLQ